MNLIKRLKKAYYNWLTKPDLMDIKTCSPVEVLEAEQRRVDLLKSVIDRQLTDSIKKKYL